MPPLLRLTVRTREPVVGFYGGCHITGGCVAFDLEFFLQRMHRVRDRLAADFSTPVDPELLKAAPWDSREQKQLQKHDNEHRKYLAVIEALPPIEAAYRQGEDWEVEARLVLFPDSRSQVESLCRPAILLREFLWAECRICNQQFTPTECAEVEWSSIAAPRAGIGGEHLGCPHGHVIFPLQTWVS